MTVGIGQPGQKQFRPLSPKSGQRTAKLAQLPVAPYWDSMFEFMLIIAAGFGAGVLNAIAGGGTFLTFPVLVFTGIPPVAANATSAVAVFPGYLSAAFGFGNEIRALPRAALWRATGAAFAGGLAGGLLLLVSSNEVFAIIVPFLLAAATLAFAFQNRIGTWLATSGLHLKPWGLAGIFAVSLYGGYFNGGLGIVLLALFALWGMENLNVMNGLKMALSFVISAVSVATFAVAGIVEWRAAVIMALAAIAGGYAGALLGKALPVWLVRAVVILTGVVMSAVFFARLF